MIAAGHYAAEEIEGHVEGLFKLWEELQVATDEKAQLLEEAISLMQFKRKVDSQQVLMSEKV